MLLNRSSLKALIRTHVINNRWYYTQSNKKKSSSLYAKISPLGNPSVNVTMELEKWVEMGNKVRFAELQRIILDLRKRKRFVQALQVSEWTKSIGSYTFTSVQHAVQLDLIGKVHGFLSAESYFDSLSEQDRTEKAYGALLHCYVRDRQVEKVFKHVQKMEDNGLTLSSVAYNDIMCLYSSLNDHDKVTDVFDQMKSKGVLPDNLSYRICINSYGVRSDIQRIESVLQEMENEPHIIMDWNTYAVVAHFYAKENLKDKANITLKKAEKRLENNNKDSVGYNHIISLHARLGNSDDVLTLWDLEKKACKRCLNRDYINVMESLLRLNELEEAEKVMKEWESSIGNCYDFRVPSVLIVGYIEKGFCEKAEALLECLMERGNSSTCNIWGRVAVGYLEKGEMEKAMRCINVALSLRDTSGEVKIDKAVMTKILSLVGEKERSDDDDQVLNLLRTAVAL